MLFSYLTWLNYWRTNKTSTAHIDQINKINKLLLFQHSWDIWIFGDLRLLKATLLKRIFRSHENRWRNEQRIDTVKNEMTIWRFSCFGFGDYNKKKGTVFCAFVCVVVQQRNIEKRAPVSLVDSIYKVHSVVYMGFVTAKGTPVGRANIQMQQIFSHWYVKNVSLRSTEEIHPYKELTVTNFAAQRNRHIYETK